MRLAASALVVWMVAAIGACTAFGGDSGGGGGGGGDSPTDGADASDGPPPDVTPDPGAPPVKVLTLTATGKLAGITAFGDSLYYSEAGVAGVEFVDLQSTSPSVMPVPVNAGTTVFPGAIAADGNSIYCVDGTTGHHGIYRLTIGGKLSTVSDVEADMKLGAVAVSVPTGSPSADALLYATDGNGGPSNLAVVYGISISKGDAGLEFAEPVPAVAATLNAERFFDLASSADAFAVASKLAARDVAYGAATFTTIATRPVEPADQTAAPSNIALVGDTDFWAFGSKVLASRSDEMSFEPRWQNPDGTAVVAIAGDAGGLYWITDAGTIYVAGPDGAHPRILKTTQPITTGPLPRPIALTTHFVAIADVGSIALVPRD